MSIFGGPNRGGGGAPLTDPFGNKVTARGQRPDTSTSYQRAFGGTTTSYVQAPLMQPGNQLLFPSITTAPLVQTQTVNQNGQPSTKAVIVPSTQSLIPPPSTLLTSHYASLPNLGTALVPSSSYSAMPTGVMQTPIHRSQYLRGSGTIIGGGDDFGTDFEKAKKAKLRNDLLNQMNDNASRRLEQRRLKSWQDEFDDERVARDRWEQQGRYNYEEWQRKKYLIKDGHLPGPGGHYGPYSGRYGHPWSSRYDYRYHASRKGKRRDGNDEYGWWYGGPQPPSRHYRGRYRDHWDGVPAPPPLPWMENQVQVKNGKSDELDPVAFYKGDMKSWWDKYVPAEVASKISTMVTDQLISMQKKLDNQELVLQKEITKLTTDATEADRDRLEALNNLRNVKKKLTDQQLQEDLRHNYIYHILFNNWKMREKMLDKDLDKLPSRTLFPQFKTNYANLGERLNWGELANDSQKLVSHLDPVSNEYLKFPSVDDVARQEVEVNIFDVERINDANHERLKNLSEMK